MNKKEIDKFIKENVQKAVENWKKEIEVGKNIQSIVKFFEERNFDMYNPDVSSELREYIFDIMDRWPRVNFDEHCLITYFFKITQSPEVFYDIDPYAETPIGDIDIFNKIE